MTLKELNIGESAVIRTVGGDGALRQHFLDMGVIPGAEVTVVKLAPMGDPMELQIHGYELTLRLADADQIEVEPIKSRSRKHGIAVYFPVSIRSSFRLRICSLLSFGFTTVLSQTFSIKENRISAMAALRSSPRSFSICKIICSSISISF